MGKIFRKNKRVYTVEFTTFAVYADTKQEALTAIKKYVKKQSGNLDNFFDMRAKATEKEIFANSA
jgi:hypothetical protein